MPGTAYENYESVDIVSRVMDITGGAGVKVAARPTPRAVQDPHRAPPPLGALLTWCAVCVAQAVIDGIGKSTVDISIDSLDRRGTYLI